MIIHLEKKELTNTQQMEIAVNGPDGATYLILCTGVAKLDSVTHNTYTFHVGPQLSRRQFVGAIASGAISTIRIGNKNPLEGAGAELDANLVSIDALFDDKSDQVKVTVAASSGTPMAKLAISYNVSILAELLID